MAQTFRKINLSMLKRLDWDSDFFQLEVFRSVNRDFDEEIMKELEFVLPTPSLTYLFSDKELQLESLGKAIDIKTTLFKTVEGSSVDTIDLYNPKMGYYSEILDLAIQSGAYSRFKIDENISEDAFYEMYKQWIDKEISQANTDIILEMESGEIAGFVSLTKEGELSRIGLVAVNESFRGKGIASKLLKKCDQIAWENGSKKILVTTQFQNIPAFKLYEKCGYEILEKKYIYHYWKK